jgi:hypothetical protein
VVSKLSKEALSQLVVSEDDLVGQAVEKAKGLLAIEGSTGRVVLRVPKTSLPARSLILLFLIGEFFAHRLGKTEFTSLSPIKLSIATGINPDTISARLSELVDSGVVLKAGKEGKAPYGKGEYYVNPFMMNEILDEIIASREAHNPSTTPSGVSTQSIQSDVYPNMDKFENLTDAIVNLLKSPWGHIPRDWREIQQALRHNSMIFSEGSVTGTLTLLYQDHRLRRIKEGRAFKYMAP